MERIPKPILSQILIAVGPVYELIQIAFVCKKWKNIIEAAYHNISFQGTHRWAFQSSNIDIKRVVSICKNNSISFKIQSLDLRNMKLEKSGIVQIFASQPRILKFNLTNSCISLDKLWKAIKIKKSSKNNRIPDELEFALEELRISNNRSNSIGYDTLIKIFPNLKRLYAGNTHTSKEDFINIVKGFKKLELLDLTNCYKIVKMDDNLNELKEALSRSKSIKKLFITDLGPKTINYLEECHIEVINKWIGTILDEFNYETDLQYLENWLNLGIDVDLAKHDNNAIKPPIFPNLELIRSNKSEILITEAFKIMIRNGLDLSFYSMENSLGLMNAAISARNYSLVNLFLEHKVDIWPNDCFNLWDPPAVTYASFCGNIPIFQLFLKYNLYPKDFDYKTFCNPICAALRNSQKEMFEFLKQNNFPNFECNQHYNIWISSPKTLELVIENIAYFPFYSLNTIVEYYILEGNRERILNIYNSLMKKGLAENQQEILRNLIDNDPDKPFIVFAAENSCQKVIENIVESGFDINAMDKFGRTALMVASSQENLELLVYLLNHGAIVDEKDITGMTALHHAVANGSLEIIKQLIRFGADPSSICNEGYSPIDFAELSDRTEAYNLLKKFWRLQKKT